MVKHHQIALYDGLFRRQNNTVALPATLTTTCNLQRRRDTLPSTDLKDPTAPKFSICGNCGNCGTNLALVLLGLALLGLALLGLLVGGTPRCLLNVITEGGGSTCSGSSCANERGVVAQQTNARTAQPGWWELLLEANICIAITHVLYA
jgi:hypothetical protein